MRPFEIFGSRSGVHCILSQETERRKTIQYNKETEQKNGIIFYRYSCLMVQLSTRTQLLWPGACASQRVSSAPVSAPVVEKYPAAMSPFTWLREGETDSCLLLQNPGRPKSRQQSHIKLPEYGCSYSSYTHLVAHGKQHQQLPASAVSGRDDTYPQDSKRRPFALVSLLAG